MIPFTQFEVTTLLGQGGLVCALVWAIRYQVNRNEILQRDLIATLRDMVLQNTAMLARVESILSQCSKNNL